MKKIRLTHTLSALAAVTAAANAVTRSSTLQKPLSNHDVVIAANPFSFAVKPGVGNTAKAKSVGVGKDYGLGGMTCIDANGKVFKPADNITDPSDLAGKIINYKVLAAGNKVMRMAGQLAAQAGAKTVPRQAAFA
jgi:hypothetical protein